jgi:flap endonuclease-1
MGLSALRDVLDPEPIDLGALEGARVAVDANNLLWTFVKGMARGGAPEGPHGRSISHVIGLVNRSTLYARLGLEPVWVFDGDPPELKAEEIQRREDKRREAEKRGDEVGATKLDEVQIRETKALLDAMGVAYFEAPGETDAQLAHWTRQGHVEAGITQDYDAPLYGCPTTLRYVKASGNRDPERVLLDDRLEEHGVTRTQLVDAAILIGTDYNDGIHGVGPVTAMKLVREHGDLHGAIEAREAEMPRAEAVRELFLNPSVAEAKPPAGSPVDADAVRDHLDRHGMPNQRAESLVDALC